MSVDGLNRQFARPLSGIMHHASSCIIHVHHRSCSSFAVVCRYFIFDLVACCVNGGKIPFVLAQSDNAHNL